MIRHYYTLFHVVNELKTLIGCKLAECFSQEKNSLIFNFSDGINENYLQYFGNPPNASLFIRNNYSRARKNSVDLFELITGDVLQNVLIYENNRIIQMDFINTKLYFLMFGGAKSNVVAINREGKIIDVLKSKHYTSGDKFLVPEANLKSIENFSAETAIINAFAKSNYNLGKYYAGEVIQRCEISADRKISEMSASALNYLKSSAEEIRSECLNSKKYYILNIDDGILLSLIRLKAYPEVIEEYTSVSEAIYKRIISEIKTDRYDSLYKEIELKLTKQQDKILKNLELMKDETKIFERAKKYNLYAELLISNPKSKMKSGNQINLKDYEGNEIIIPLDEKLTLMENANKYFAKAKNAKEELRIRKKRLPELELRLYKIENAVKLLNEAKTYNELDKLKKNLKDLTGIRMTEESNDISTKFREFDLGEGYTLYVGKNAANNDELTMKFAKPNDMWFHSRGSGGSHAVLRLNKDQKPSKSIIKKAAAIVAYYSQARNAKYTPVAYTYKKYVRKPKGANPGTVMITREEVIMVEPGLPE
jgi:predicted ribosome quality control (RQC) complex YloA/Tae2 family protein